MTNNTNKENASYLFFLKWKYAPNKPMASAKGNPNCLQSTPSCLGDAPKSDTKESLLGPFPANCHKKYLIYILLI